MEKDLWWKSDKYTHGYGDGYLCALRSSAFTDETTGPYFTGFIDGYLTSSRKKLELELEELELKLQELERRLELELEELELELHELQEPEPEQKATKPKRFRPRKNLPKLAERFRKMLSCA